MITYQHGNDLNINQVIELYVASTLGQRRPVDDVDRMQLMLKNSNLTVTAWDEQLLVGIARSVTDWAYCTYLSDLAVRESYQKKGIGKMLIHCTQQMASNTTLILLSAPAAVGYYPKIGMENHPSAWMLRPGNALKI